MNRQTVIYQAVVYQQSADAPGGQHIIMLLRTPDEALARFLVAQALLLPRHPGEQQESVRYWAELRRGHHTGPLDSGSWRPTRPDDTTCAVALFDPDTGSLEWEDDQPTYVVITENPRCNVISLRDGR